MNVVGYTLSGQDNGTYMFRDKSTLPTCSGCHCRLDFTATNSGYQLTSSSADFSYTYDGQAIVSVAFKEICELNGYTEIKFGVFTKDPNHFHLLPQRQFEFDAARRETKFLDLCPICGRYESIIGATPAFFKMNDPLADGVYRSDLLFASGNEKSPLILVGIATRKTFKDSKLRGLEFKEAYGFGGDVEEVFAAAKAKRQLSLKKKRKVDPITNE
jgi:hypothetical protein